MKPLSTLLLLFLGGATAVTALALQSPSKGPASLDPDASSTWLGASVSEVMKAVGAPSQIRPIGDDLQRWGWKASGEGVLSATVLGDQVVRFDAGLADLKGSASAIPVDGMYLGQSVTQLLQRLGQPDDVRGVPIPWLSGRRPEVPRWRDVLIYGDVWVTVVGGRVLGMGPPEVDRRTGPR